MTLNVSLMHISRNMGLSVDNFLPEAMRQTFVLFYKRFLFQLKL